MTKSERLASAALVRRLLDAVERGDLEASTPRGRALLTYLAGAVAALEAGEAARVMDGDPGPADARGGFPRGAARHPSAGQSSPPG